MPQSTLTISHRDLGQNLNQLRNKEIIPGIMYGQSFKHAMPIQINLKTLQRIISSTSESTLFTLMLDNEPYECILRNYQPDPLHNEILHVDFQYVKPGETIKMQIPVAYTGTEYLRSQKLVLEKALSKIPVVGPIDELPQTFTIELGSVARGYKVFAHQVQLPKNTELLVHPEAIIATIQ